MKQRSMTSNPFKKGDVRFFRGIRKKERERFMYVDHNKVTPKSVVVTSYGRIMSGNDNVLVSTFKKKNGSVGVSITDKNLNTKTILMLSHLVADAFVQTTDRDEALHRDCVVNVTDAKSDVRYNNLKRHSRYEIGIITKLKGLDVEDDNYGEQLAIIIHKLMDRKYTVTDILYVIGMYLPMRNKKNFVTRVFNKEIYHWVTY